MPQSIRPYYTAGMFLAATGYFAFTYFILFRLPPNDTKVANRYGYGIFNGLYIAILIPSALWMPFTFLAVEQSSMALLWVVRLVLGLVALASLGSFWALITVKPRQPSWAHRTAVVGSIGFYIQTVFLDGLVWGAFFQV